MKKFICFIFAAAMALLVVGCGIKPAASESGQKIQINIKNEVPDCLKAIGITYYLGENALGSVGAEHADGSLLGEEEISFRIKKEDVPAGADLSDFNMKVSVTDADEATFDACELRCTPEFGKSYSFLLKGEDGCFSLGEVNDTSANLIIAQMLFLEAQDPSKDIQLYINSPGGSITAGFAIYDTMKYLKCDVSTICVGLAASFGAFLLAGGTKGKRIALRNSEIMIHQPAIHGNGVQGQATDILIVSDHLQRTKARLNTILAENTGRSLEEIVTATERDNYMFADEALDFGLIDKIITYRD